MGCAGNAESKSASCRTSSSYELARKSDSYHSLNDPINILKIPAFNGKGSCQVVVENLQTESIQKIESLKNVKEFREIVAELQANGEAVMTSSLESNPNLKQSFIDASLSKASLYIFVSFSMGEKALLNLAQEAKQFGTTLVLRGFKEGSYRKTAQSLQKIINKTRQGVLIDPELYTLFDITSVPTFVFAKPFPAQSQERVQTPIHDKLQGHVSVHYALETFAKEGNLKQEAQYLLLEGGATP